MAESDWADKTAENVAKLLLLAEALGMRKAAKMVETTHFYDGHHATPYRIAKALRARADRIERGEDA